MDDRFQRTLSSGRTAAKSKDFGRLRTKASMQEPAGPTRWSMGKWLWDGSGGQALPIRKWPLRSDRRDFVRAGLRGGVLNWPVCPVPGSILRKGTRRVIGQSTARRDRRVGWAMPDHGACLPAVMLAAGGARGWHQRAKVSMMVMCPPQHGHGGRWSGGSSGSGSSTGAATPSSLRASAMAVLVGRTGEQAVMPDAVEAARQDVDQEAADELVGRQRHDLLAFGAVAAIVLVAERDAGLVEADEPPVRDGNAVRVAREIGQHRLRPGEGRLGIDHPALLPDRRRDAAGRPCVSRGAPRC